MSLKKALATLLATVMMLSLVSCGSKSNEEAPDDASKPTESAESSGKIKVGFSSAAFSDEWCHNLALAFENLTATEYPEIEATVLDGNIDAEKQINSVSLGGQQLSNTSSSAEENATGRTATNGEEVGPFCNNRIRGLGFRRGRTGRCTAG